MAHNQDAGEIKIKVGDIIPAGSFGYVPYTPELEDGVRDPYIFAFHMY